MSEEHEISDREFLDQIHERLTSSGHGVVIIDVGIYRIGKFIAVIFSLFAFFALFGFGIDVNQVRNEAHEIKLAMEKDRDQIKTNLDEIKEISKESKKLLRGVDNRIESFANISKLR